MEAKPNQRPTPWNRSRAFSRPGMSLIEVVMALAIMGILAAIAVPRMTGSIARQRAQTAANRIASDIELARSAAMASSSSRKVVFSPAKEAYVLPALSNPLDRSPAPYVIYLSSAPYSAKIAAVSFGDDTGLTYSPVFQTDRVGEVAFNGFGMPDTAGWITVRCNDYLYKVTLDASGRTTVARISEATLSLDISSSPSTVVEEAEDH